MKALIFTPKVANTDKSVSEARMASLAALTYIYTLEASKMLKRGERPEAVAVLFSERVMSIVTELYPCELDGFGEICTFAERHGLQSKVRASVVDGPLN